jgi:hypothetical protein
MHNSTKTKIFKDQDLKLAFNIFWFIFTLFFLICLITPYIIEDTMLYNFLPDCEWKVKFGTPCITCGLTHSFYAISKGNIYEAYRYNNLGMYLYIFFIINNTTFTFYLLKKLLHQIKYANS